MWHPVGWRRTAASLAGATVLCLPWAIADPKVFWNDVVSLHLDRPPRLGALTIHAAAVRAGWIPPGWLTGSIVLTAIACLAVWVRRHQPSLSGLAVAAALTLLIANLLNNQAFINQYWLVAGLALLALSEPPYHHDAVAAADHEQAAVAGGQTRTERLTQSPY
jgi:hypothetical protein